MISKLGKSKGKVKEKSVPVGFRLPVSITERVDKFGTRGTELAKLAARFIIVKELCNQNEPEKLINLEHDQILYITSLFPSDVYHLTVKNGSDIKTIELSSDKVANLIVNLVDLLNIDHQLKAEN